MIKRKKEDIYCEANAIKQSFIITFTFCIIKPFIITCVNRCTVY